MSIWSALGKDRDGGKWFHNCGCSLRTLNRCSLVLYSSCYGLPEAQVAEDVSPCLWKGEHVPVPAPESFSGTCRRFPSFSRKSSTEVDGKSAGGSTESG